MRHMHIADKIPVIKKKCESIKNKFISALPAILFFLFLFYAVIFLFGIQHIIIVTLITILFQINSTKRQSIYDLLRLSALQFVMALLAFLATLNLSLCVILNLLVPFWLIFSKTSQFNQLGYFSGLMTFTFFQLTPVGWGGILSQIEALVFGLMFFIVVTLLYTRRLNQNTGFKTEQRGMQLLGTVIEQKINETIDKESLEALFQIQQALYKDAYQKRGKKHIVTADGKRRYMFALMFQRAIYFVSSPIKITKGLEDSAESKEFLLQVAEYMKKAGTIDFWNEDTNELEVEGKRLLQIAETHSENEYQSIYNFLSMFLLILEQMDQEEQQLMDESWKIPFRQKIIERFSHRMKPDAFELRFALRMSVVLIIGMSYNILVKANHGYWLVMNAFLLLRPMYEDSKYRMKTRFIGTTIGCLLFTLLLPLCQGTLQHFLLASVMAAFIYTSTPGTSVQALFVTCFSLLMTTMAMGETMALKLRMIYVIAAVLLVLVVNRFFFPTSLGTQFRYNCQMIFHMHHMYLRLLENALVSQLNYWRICNAQIQYHMVHDQLQQYLNSMPKEQLNAEKDDYEELLAVSWRMVAEIDQMLFLVNRKRREVQAVQYIKEYIYYTDYVLNQIQEMLHLKKEKKIKDIQGMTYRRVIEEEPQLSVLMVRYAKNISKLYALVCRKYEQE